MINVNLVRIYHFFGMSNSEVIFNYIYKEDGVKTLIVSDINFTKIFLVEKIIYKKNITNDNFSNSKQMDDFLLLIEKNAKFRNIVTSMKSFSIVFNAKEISISVTCIPYIPGGVLIFKYNQVNRKINTENGL